MFNRYIKDDEGIKKYFAAFHLHDNIPSTVIIDGFGDFFVERYFVPFRNWIIIQLTMK